MNIAYLNGIETDARATVQDNARSQMKAMMTRGYNANVAHDINNISAGYDFSKFKGNGDIEDQEMVRNYLVHTKSIVDIAPSVAVGYQEPKQLSRMIGHVLDNWDTANREAAIDNMAHEEERLISIGSITVEAYEEPFMLADDEVADHEELRGVGRNRYVRRPEKRGFFNQLRKLNSNPSLAPSARKAIAANPYLRSDKHRMRRLTASNRTLTQVPVRNGMMTHSVVNTNAMRGLAGANMNHIDAVLNGTDLLQYGNGDKVQDQQALKNHLTRQYHILASQPETYFEDDDDRDEQLGAMEEAIASIGTPSQEYVLGMLAHENEELREEYLDGAKDRKRKRKQKRFYKNIKRKARGQNVLTVNIINENPYVNRTDDGARQLTRTVPLGATHSVSDFNYEQLFENTDLGSIYSASDFNYDLVTKGTDLDTTNLNGAGNVQQVRDYLGRTMALIENNPDMYFDDQQDYEDAVAAINFAYDNLENNAAMDALAGIGMDDEQYDDFIGDIADELSNGTLGSRKSRRAARKAKRKEKKINRANKRAAKKTKRIEKRSARKKKAVMKRSARQQKRTDKKVSRLTKRATNAKNDRKRAIYNARINKANQKAAERKEAKDKKILDIHENTQRLQKRAEEVRDIKVRKANATTRDERKEIAKEGRKKYWSHQKENAKRAGQKIKEGFQKVGKFFKKVIKILIKYNPICLLIRGGLLMCISLNMFRLAGKLYPGTLSFEDAQKLGVTQGDHEKCIKGYNNALKIYTNIGGTKEVLDMYLVTGANRQWKGSDDYSKIELTQAAEKNNAILEDLVNKEGAALKRAGAVSTSDPNVTFEYKKVEVEVETTAVDPQGVERIVQEAINGLDRNGYINGALGAIATAASVTAAGGVIAAIIAFLNKIGLGGDWLKKIIKKREEKQEVKDFENLLPEDQKDIYDVATEDDQEAFRNMTSEERDAYFYSGDPNASTKAMADAKKRVQDEKIQELQDESKKRDIQRQIDASAANSAAEGKYSSYDSNDFNNVMMPASTTAASSKVLLATTAALVLGGVFYAWYKNGEKENPQPQIQIDQP